MFVMMIIQIIMIIVTIKIKLVIKNAIIGKNCSNNFIINNYDKNSEIIIKRQHTLER